MLRTRRAMTTADANPGYASLPVPLAHARSGVMATAVVLGAALARLYLIHPLGLTDTEAYYAAWARFPSASYYDHPPMIAWMIGLTTRASDSATAVRLGPLLCGVAFAALLYRFTRDLFTPRAGLFAVVIATALPVVSATGFIANPEGPLLPLWVLVLWSLHGLGVDRAAWRPLALGAAVGVAFLCKFTAVLAVPVAALYLASSRETRGWFRRPSLYLGGALALLLAAPVIGWNLHHHWPSLQLHLVERMPPGAEGAYAHHAARLAVGQLVLFHPLILPGLLAAAVLAVRRAVGDRRHRLLAVASAPVLGFFFAVMVRAHDAEAHWTLVGYVPLVIAAAVWLDEVFDRASARLARYLRACVALSVAVLSVAVIHSRSTALLRLLPAGDGDPVNETLGWDELRAAIALEAPRLGPGVVLASSHNVLCGHLLTETRDAPRTYCVSPARTAFDFLDRRTPPPGAPVLYIDSARYPGDPAALLRGYRCRDLRRVRVTRGPREIGSFRLAACAVNTR
jgi:4-amino-4-deoxy-L-arabinose transferase-like glycosyltransferase